MVEILKMKSKIEYEGTQTIIRCRLEWSEQIAYDELAIFDKKLIRGLMKPFVTGTRKIQYSVPGGVSLHTYLKKGLNKDSFFVVFAQIVEMTKKVKFNGLSLDNLYLALNCTFINEETEELYFTYLPIKGNKYVMNINAFLCNMAYSAVFKLDEDTEFINKLVNYLNNIEEFSIEKMESYILSEYPDVYNKVLRQEFHSDKETDSAKITSEKPSAGETIENEKNTISKDKSEIISDVDKDKTAKFDDGEKTTIILDDEDTGTVILEEESNSLTAYLIRIKNCEHIDINTASFKIGKVEQAEYAITDNKTISRLHAEIIQNDNSYYIKDNNSTNGTFIDGNIISADELVELNDGCEITFANEKFEFHIEG